MKKTNIKKNFWGYMGRFSLIHLISYTIIAALFLLIQEALPASSKIALDFFKSYRTPELMVLVAQLIRGGVMAIVLYPFYEIIVKSNRGWLILLGALWGLTLLGSLEPMPGSIEGLIYTQTTLIEHFLVVAAGALQVLLFCWLFLKWENRPNVGRKLSKTGEEIDPALVGHKTQTSYRLKSYVGRFTLVHVLVYWIAGSVFYQLSGYEVALANMEYFALWRPLESLPMVAAVFLGQIIRGGILALLLYPFFQVLITKHHGWLLLFGLLFGLKVLGSPIFIANFIESTVMVPSITEFIASLKIGVPEIIAQTLLFSIIFVGWVKRRKLPAFNLSSDKA